MDTIILHIPFTIEQNGKKFSDALNMSQEEYESLTQEQIDAMKQARFDAWLEFLANPPIPDEPPEEDLLLEKEHLEKELDKIQKKIDNIHGNPNVANIEAIN